jgi:uncharacterized membrane protein
VNRLISLTLIASTALVQGCATTSETGAKSLAANAPTGVNEESAIALAPDGKKAVNGASIGATKDLQLIEGHPLTSVVVTQCNLVVAVYMTMEDGKLLRFDSKANVPAEDLVAMAYTATRSERVEVSCNGSGVTGYETHLPT